MGADKIFENHPFSAILRVWPGCFGGMEADMGNAAAWCEEEGFLGGFQGIDMRFLAAPRTEVGGSVSNATITAVKGVFPQIALSAFVAPGCRILGDVSLGENASVWYNCVIRGDMSHIRIGARTNIQDSCMIHCDTANPDHPIYPTLIGDDCMIGHMSLLHGCNLEDRAVAGMGTIIFNGAMIESDGMLAAGAMLTSGKVIRRGELWTGRPAKYLRDLTAKEIASNQAATAFYIENCCRHENENG